MTQPPASPAPSVPPGTPPPGGAAAGSSMLFLPSPATRAIDDELYLLTEPYRVCLPGHVLSIRAGYIFDGASIPRLLWTSCGAPMEGQLQAPAIIHDALYSTEYLPRNVADDILYKCMRLNHVTVYRAWKIWAGVRMFGGLVWRAHTAAGIAHARAFVELSVG